MVTNYNWREGAKKGHILMRDGEDYVNNNKRYDRAHILLNTAYNAAILDKTAKDIELANICLWNENLDINPFTKRNEEALKWYKRGLAYIRNNCNTKQCIITKASLYNSIGVAHHHQTTRWTTGGPIPQSSFYNYNKACKIINDNPNYKNAFKLLSTKLKQNSGGRIKFLGGDNNSSYIGSGGNYVSAF